MLAGTVTVDGEVAAESAPLFFLDGRALEPLRADGSQAVLEGTTMKLKDEAAQVRNEALGTDALAGGLVIGVAKITIDTACTAASRHSTRKARISGLSHGRSWIRTRDLFLIREAL